MDWYELPKNVPSSTDTPFAVGPNVEHRFDFGNSDKVCVTISGGECLNPNATSYEGCVFRCWGDSYDPPTPWGKGWTYPEEVGLPQGRVQTLAGRPDDPGYTDGAAGDAQFNNPQGVVADALRNVFVADTDNHVIRRIDAVTKEVTTVAGVGGEAGYRDGAPAQALFSSPIGISLFYDCAAGAAVPDCGPLVLVVADSNNHRIRRVVFATGEHATASFVDNLAGGGLNLPMGTAPFGLADANGTDARFDHPHGLVAREDGTVYVCDTNNHLIREVSRGGNVTTLAGTVIRQPLREPGCPAPCLEGVQGWEDGELRTAKFSNPEDVALGENNTLLVVDTDRLRRILLSDSLQSTIQGVASQDRVVTLAGSLEDGEADGIGPEARFDKPRGVTMTADGNIYVADSLSCRIRRVTPADHVAQAITCDTRGVDVVRPAGCQMYDEPVDSVDEKATPKTGNIFYNYEYPDRDGDQLPDVNGRHVPSCVGIPSADLGIRNNNVTLGPRLGTAAERYHDKEDQDDLTTIRLLCPPGCAATTNPVYGGGDGFYADESAVCAAAIHDGLLTDAGGLLSLQLRRGRGTWASPGYQDPLVGVAANGVTSLAMDFSQRTFSLAAYNLSIVEVQTISGQPSAPLDGPMPPCGHKDSQPPLSAMFDGPSRIHAWRHANLSDTELLYIADSANSVIRTLTASCTKPCENGGRCVGADLCACQPGWTGPDCATPECAGPCGDHQICLGGAEGCTCAPGFTGADCMTPLCIQECRHGFCSAPDTCECDYGWFDANCTTPVCTQSCGNGGNCTAPDTCTCPGQWMGHDCRTPICTQLCLHGTCTAPESCTCEPGWSGHDCSKPICEQGFLRADPTPHSAPPGKARAFRDPAWPQYTPCDIMEWCNSTNRFDCQQLQRQFFPTALPPIRNHTGRAHSPAPYDGCFPIELNLTAMTPYRYENSTGEVSGYYWRDAPVWPYHWGPTNSSHPWSAPSPAAPDRQIALVTWQTVTQGVYVCANGGNCTAPNTCRCAPGWIGFDCRIPVCTNGYFQPDRRHPLYLAGPPDDPSAGTLSGPNQGTYQCSKRAVTIWESFSTPIGKFRQHMHDHPNYCSAYMDNAVGWPPTYSRHQPLGDDTVEGWRRDGWCERIPNTYWQHGECGQYYNRTCAQASKMTDLRTFVVGEPVNFTYDAFHSRVDFSDPARVHSYGRWYEEGGECIDHVELGCFNGGTCVAPDTCECPDGWEGHDCSLPVCKQTVATVPASETYSPDHDQYEPFTLLRADGENEGTWGGGDPPARADDEYVQFRKCPNNGNCTLPDTCTCEKGWGGDDCTVPLCAQECFNGGECVAPDTCRCAQWRNAFRDDRGRPSFAKSNGDPQHTGWTGFDCNVPICVQASRWVPNSEDATVHLVASVNDGRTFQAGCSPAGRFTPENRTRVSEYLCGKEVWWQGVYQDTWANELGESHYSSGREVRVNHPNFIQVSEDVWVDGPKVEGEGSYACFNGGTCVAPDTCECPDGWSGYDCNTPLCRHLNYYNEIVGCLNNGICADKDDCQCMVTESRLPEIHPEIEEGAMTGYQGSDCSIAICAQGWYDPDCVDVPPGVGGVASGGEGCYRCANGGNCTAPDMCTCPPDWTGYDCRTPVCTQHADEATIFQLDTVDTRKIQAFEKDPCGTNLKQVVNGVEYGQGNCSSPNTCTCFCKQRSWLNADGELVEEPWTDPIGRALNPGVIFGDSDCLDGFQGHLNPDGSFRTCHLQIKVPTWFERNTLIIIIIAAIVIFLILVIYCFVRRKLQQRLLAIKAERRRSRRSEERTAFTA